MKKVLLMRTWKLVAAFAVLGLVAGAVAGYAYSGLHHDQAKAQATLAMLPAPEIPLLDMPNYLEVLNQGQATRSAAIALGDTRWLDAAAAETGVPRSELALTAGAIPETTLITVAVQADSAEAAGRVLDWVLKNASDLAASAVGPFVLRVISAPKSSGSSMGPAPIQLVAAFAVGGLLVGAAAALILSRLAHRRFAPDDGDSTVLTGPIVGGDPGIGRHSQP